MISEFVAMLMASATSAVPAPTGAVLSSYSTSLVQVNWTNSGGGVYQTKVYRKLGAGAWELLTTQAAGVTSYQTGDASASGYTYGVAHFNSGTGGESSVAEASAAPPPMPTSANSSLY